MNYKAIRRVISLIKVVRHILVLIESSAFIRYTPSTMFVHFLTKLLFHNKGKGHHYFFIIRSRSFISVRLSE